VKLTGRKKKLKDKDFERFFSSSDDIPWAELTEDDTQGFFDWMARVEADLQQQLTTSQSTSAIVPLGYDRTYRRYWVFRSMPGLFVEVDAGLPVDPAGLPVDPAGLPIDPAGLPVNPAGLLVDPAGLRVDAAETINATRSCTNSQIKIDSDELDACKLGAAARELSGVSLYVETSEIKSVKNDNCNRNELTLSSDHSHVKNSIIQEDHCLNMDADDDKGVSITSCKDGDSADVSKHSVVVVVDVVGVVETDSSRSSEADVVVTSDTTVKDDVNLVTDKVIVNGCVTDDISSEVINRADKIEHSRVKDESSRVKREVVSGEHIRVKDESSSVKREVVSAEHSRLKDEPSSLETKNSTEQCTSLEVVENMNKTCWYVYRHVEDIDLLISALNPRGIRESALRQALTERKNQLSESLSVSNSVSSLLVSSPPLLPQSTPRVTGDKSSVDDEEGVTVLDRGLEISLREMLLDLEDRVHIGCLGLLQVININLYHLCV